MPEITIKKNGRTTLKDIALLAEVSVSTASLVLAGKGAERRISAEVEQRVREVARQQDYSPNLLVHSLQQGRTHIISFYSAFHNRERNDLYMDRVATAIERAAGQRHYDVLVQCDFSRPVEALYQGVNGGRADGLIFFGPGDTDPLLPLLRSSRLPTVLLNRADEQGILSSVQDDMAQGIAHVAAALVERGHRRIGAVAASAGTDASPRIATLRAALGAYGIALPDRWVLPVYQDEPETAEQALRFFMSEPEPPTALFCWHDRVGYLLLEICDRLGITVPQQLSLIGYDGLHWPSTSRHVLTSISVDIDTLAEAAVHLLDTLITGTQSAPISQVFPIGFVEGTTLASAFEDACMPP